MTNTKTLVALGVLIVALVGCVGIAKVCLSPLARFRRAMRRSAGRLDEATLVMLDRLPPSAAQDLLLSALAGLSRAEDYEGAKARNLVSEKLGRMGSTANVEDRSKIITALIHVMKKEDEGVARALGHIGVAMGRDVDKRIIDALLTALHPKTGSCEVCHPSLRAVEALGLIGAAMGKAVDQRIVTELRCLLLHYFYDAASAAHTAVVQHLHLRPVTPAEQVADFVAEGDWPSLGKMGGTSAAPLVVFATCIGAPAGLYEAVDQALITMGVAAVDAVVRCESVGPREDRWRENLVCKIGSAALPPLIDALSDRTVAGVNRQSVASSLLKLCPPVLQPLAQYLTWVNQTADSRLESRVRRLTGEEVELLKRHLARGTTVKIVYSSGQFVEAPQFGRASEDGDGYYPGEASIIGDLELSFTDLPK